MLEEAILLDITLPELPPTINKLYPANKTGKRFISNQGFQFKKHTAQLIQLQERGFTIPQERAYEFFLVCYYPEPVNSKTAKDYLLECDSDNRLKAAKDSVFEASLLDEETMTRADDSLVFADYCAKKRGTAEMLREYPKGYCRAVLAYTGFTGQILEYLGAVEKAGAA